MSDLRDVFLGLFAALAAATAIVAPASAQQKPNVLIMGDDIGYWNISADDRGCRDADRHVGGGVRRGSEEVDRHGPAPSSK